MLDPSQFSYSSQVPLDHKEHFSCFQESGNNPNLAPAMFTEVWELSVKQFSISSGLPQDNRVLFWLFSQMSRNARISHQSSEVTLDKQQGKETPGQSRKLPHHGGCFNLIVLQEFPLAMTASGDLSMTP